MPGVLPTPAHKVVAGAMAAGGLAAAVLGGPNGEHHSGRPAVELVIESPMEQMTGQTYLNSARGHFTTANGERVYWFRDIDPPDTAYKIQEDGEGGLTAVRDDGCENPIAFTLHVPTVGTQENGSPQQARDPNSQVSFIYKTPKPVVEAIEKRGGNPVMEQRLTLVEDGKGGLYAVNDLGQRVEADIPIGFQGIHFAGKAAAKHVQTARQGGEAGPKAVARVQARQGKVKPHRNGNGGGRTVHNGGGGNRHRAHRRQR
jgi:hypothetical protein